MSWIMVDIEADGPVPGDYSMISIGAVIVDEKLDKTFYATLKPISERYNPQALAITGFTREQTLNFKDPREVMQEFALWLQKHSKNRLRFISDNNGFDWMFICWYFHHFLGYNPFGHSSSNMGSLYKGMVGDTSKSFRVLRKTRHTHNALQDAIDNAQALLAMKKEYKLRINL